MAPRDRLHIFVLRPAASEDYTSYGTGRVARGRHLRSGDAHATRWLREEAAEADARLATAGWRLT